LFFLLLGVFSIFFPFYQKYRGIQLWTLIYPIAILIVLSGPLFMMGGIARSLIGAFMVLLGGYLIWSNTRNGWKLEGPVDAPVLREG
jgi:hypothetical protein